jgi:hypothetical protein
MKKLLSRIDFMTLIFASLTLGLAPFSPPHIVEKLGMLFSGTLVKPIDIFDLFLHGTPWVFLILKTIFYFKDNGSSASK